jgi:hypothetical protein
MNAIAIGSTASEEDHVGQEPNYPLGFEDLPRPTPKPAAPRRWRPQRPGEVGSPDEMPWGGSFGTPGPDIGFAIKIARARGLPGTDDEHADVEAAIVAVMAARASAIGRAPTNRDFDVAVDLLDLEAASGIAALDGIAHDRARLTRLVAAIARDTLTA